MIRGAVASALCLVSLALAPAHAAVERVQAGNFGQVLEAAPGGAPTATVIVFSDAAGWRDDEDKTLRAIAATGALAIGVDAPAYLAQAQAGQTIKRQGDCLDVFQDVEDAARAAEARHPSSFYNLPYAIGVGVGGALADVAAEQAPAATFSGAVSVDAWASAPTSRPLCRGASPAGGQSSFLAARSEGGEIWTAAFDAAPPTQTRPNASDLAQAGAQVQRLSGSKSWENLLSLLGAQRRSADASGVASLPLIALPAEGAGSTMAVILSGDGGWRDLDKTIGENLQKSGVSVMGWDSLRYFWNRKTPEQAARHLSRALKAYSEKWKATKVVLIGYSFGADVLPALYNRLSGPQKDEVALMSLLGVEASADWEVRVSGWFGAGPSTQATPLAPELAKISPALIQCFYGVDETDSLCPSLGARGVETVETTGGHHFDGDYQGLTRRILEGLSRRGAR